MKSNKLKDLLHQQFHQGYNKGYSKGHSDAVHFTIDLYTAVLLICLRDKFDFTAEQLEEVTAHIGNQFDSIDQGYVTFEDILKTLNDEVGLRIIYDRMSLKKETPVYIGVDFASGDDISG